MLTNEEARHNISVNLRRMLQSRGWSQQQLADRCDVLQVNISRILGENRLPRIDVLARIAEALETSVDLLLSPPRETATNRS